jgi:hypothetical protein
LKPLNNRFSTFIQKPYVVAFEDLQAIPRKRSIINTFSDMDDFTVNLQAFLEGKLLEEQIRNVNLAIHIS